MDHLTNERGETVVAEGAPGSLARLRCEYPDTWGERADEDQLLALLSCYPPTHRTPIERELINGEEHGGLPLWKLFERTVGGRREYVYAHWCLPPGRVPRWVDQSYFYEEQEQA